MTTQGRPGVLLDRDGTLIEERHYLADPAEVVLLPGAAAAVARLNAAGIPVGLVTNQSGVARGYFDLATVERVHARLAELLAAEGARLDGVWFCPHHPEHGGACPCRKPAPGMAQDASLQLGLDLVRSYVVGDKRCDVELGRAVGATPLMVRTGHGARELGEAPESFRETLVFDDLAGALGYVLGELEAA